MKFYNERVGLNTSLLRAGLIVQALI